VVERLPLIYFLVVFPIIVLGVFAWLVSRYSVNLFSPSDFRDEKNYVEMINRRTLATVASLTVAAAKDQKSISDDAIDRIVESVQRSTSISIGPSLVFSDPHVNNVISHNVGSSVTRSNDVLWVDDRPENNIHERQALEGAGVTFTLAQSTNEALEYLSRRRFIAIISDMGRREGPREGYVLLDTLRQRGDQTPLFFYAASNDPEHKHETAEHGGQGCTNNALELFNMVLNVITGR
jgi:CheY-like chemotaxis protein